MGIFDSVRSRFKNNDEEEFERAFQEGAWPQGVELEPMTNTGSFLPATYDIDPLADASLPGNALAAASTGAHAAAAVPVNPPAAAPATTPVPMPGAPAASPSDSSAMVTESVVRAAATSIYVAPPAESPFQVIDASLKPRAAAVPDPGATAVQPALQFAPQPGMQPGMQPANPPRQEARPEMEEDNVQVFSRPTAAHAAPRTDQKTFADRLRERVAAGATGSVDDTLIRAQAAAPAMRPTRRNDDASDAELDAELEERRRNRRNASNARAAEKAASQAADARASQSGRTDAPHGDAVRAPGEPMGGVREPDAPRGASGSETAEPAIRPGKPEGLKPVPISCVVIRPRTYDDVRDIAQTVIAERRPVVLMLRGCTGDLARRVIDFSFGLCCGTNASMREFGDHVYGVFPRGTTLTEDDIVTLRRQGILRG